MIAYMRNVRTGEVRGVQLDSDEFDEMKEEVYDKGDGRGYPAWEQTGKHVVNRIDSGDVQVPEDLGEDYTPVADLTARGPLLPPDPNPEQSLTPAEREAGIEDHESKMADLGITTPGQDLINEGLSHVGSDPESGGDSDGSGGTQTKRQLQDEARDLGVTGFSNMNKEDLQTAIDEANDEAKNEGDQGSEEDYSAR